MTSLPPTKTAFKLVIKPKGYITPPTTFKSKNTHVRCGFLANKAITTGGSNP